MNDFIRDLISDLRFTRRKIIAGLNVAEEAGYAAAVVAQLNKCLAHRHDESPLDEWGYPNCLQGEMK